MSFIKSTASIDRVLAVCVLPLSMGIFGTWGLLFDMAVDRCSGLLLMERLSQGSCCHDSWSAMPAF